jgi:hypothetical protein
VWYQITRVHCVSRERGTRGVRGRVRCETGHMVPAHRVLTQQVRVRCHAKHAPVVPWVLLCDHVSVGTVCARVPESYGLIRIASG